MERVPFNLRITLDRREACHPRPCGIAKLLFDAFLLTAPLLTAIALSLCIVGPAAAECGQRGGPGYRGPNGKCVGWAEMGRVCGTPPETRCRAEAVAPNASEAAGHGAKIEELRQPQKK